MLEVQEVPALLVLVQPVELELQHNSFQSIPTIPMSSSPLQPAVEGFRSLLVVAAVLAAEVLAVLALLSQEEAAEAEARAEASFGLQLQPSIEARERLQVASAHAVEPVGLEQAAVLEQAAEVVAPEGLAVGFRSTTALSLERRGRTCLTYPAQPVEQAEAAQRLAVTVVVQEEGVRSLRSTSLLA